MKNCIIFLLLIFSVTIANANSPKEQSCTTLIAELLSSGISPSQVTSLKGHGIFRLRPSQVSYSKLNPLKERTIIDPREEILATKDIIETTKLVAGKGKGVNASYIVRLDDNIRAIWKPHEEEWYSNYRTEVLAYEIDRLLGFNLVPPTVERQINGKKGSLQLFMESGDKNNISEIQLKKQSFFDFLINHGDRHASNYLAAPNGDVISIDNGISFIGKGMYQKKFEIHKPDIDAFLDTLEGEKIIKKIKSLDLDVFQKEVAEYLGKEDADKFIERLIFTIEYYEGKQITRSVSFREAS